MQTSWKLVVGAGAAAVLIAVTSGLTTGYLLRPTSGSNGGAVGGLDITPETDRMAEPRRGIVDYLRTPTTPRLTTARVGATAGHLQHGLRKSPGDRAATERECDASLRDHGC